MKRWTIEELKNIKDIDFAICILNERKNSLSNPYSPLMNKLCKTIATLSEVKERRNE